MSLPTLKYGLTSGNVPGAVRISSDVRSQALHPLLERRPLGRRHVQAFLGPSPQHVVGLDRPFLAHQVAHLDLVEMAAKVPAEIGHAADIVQQVVQPGPVPAGKNPHQFLR